MHTDLLCLRVENFFGRVETQKRRKTYTCKLNLTKNQSLMNTVMWCCNSWIPKIYLVLQIRQLSLFHFVSAFVIVVLSQLIAVILVNDDYVHKCCSCCVCVLVWMNYGLLHCVVVISWCCVVFQYFTDRMHQLVQCKYMHLLRWKRFLQHTSVIESLYADFNSRLWSLTICCFSVNESLDWLISDC